MIKTPILFSTVNKNESSLCHLFKKEVGHKSYVLKNKINKFFSIRAYEFLEEMKTSEMCQQWKKFYNLSQSSLIDSIVYLQKHQELSQKIYEFCIPFKDKIEIDLDKWNHFIYEISNLLLDRRSQLEDEDINLFQYFHMNDYICYSILFNQKYSYFSQENHFIDKISYFYELFLQDIKNSCFPSKEIIQKINEEYCDLFRKFIKQYTSIEINKIDYKMMNRMLEDSSDLFGQYKEFLIKFKEGDINFLINFLENIFLVDIKCASENLIEQPHFLWMNKQFYNNIGFHISQCLEEDELSNILSYLFLHHHPFNIQEEYIDHKFNTNILCCSNIHDNNFIFLKKYFEDIEKTDYEYYNVYLIMNWIKQKAFYLNVNPNLILKDILPLERIKLFLLDGCQFSHLFNFLNSTDKILYQNLNSQLLSLEKEIAYDFIIDDLNMKVAPCDLDLQKDTKKIIKKI